MKKILKFLLLNIFIFIFPLIVRANSIDKIDMDIYLDSNGTAHITEVWSANLTEGTEGYKPYYNIGNAKITNFKVSENGKEYAYQDNWNTNASFNNKAYKNGINYISDGLELCFGISSYGYHNYKLTYDIEGFVASLTDSDMIYWNLVPYELSSKPQDVHIKIYSDNYFSDTLDVWGYGKYGATTYVYDGYIEMNSDGILNSNEYMTVLVKFDKGTFNTYNKIDKDFKYYKKMADKGTNKYKKSFIKDNFAIILFIIIFAIILLSIVHKLILIVINFIKNNSNIMKYKPIRVSKYKKIIGSKFINFKKYGKISLKNIENYRDIPFNNDIYRAFWIAESYKLNKKKTDLLGAILLKWLKEKRISIRKIESNSALLKEQFVIDLTNKNIFYNDLEEELYKMLVNASYNYILESKEFENWCKINYKEILNWFNKVLDNETDKLIYEEKIITKTISNSRIYVSELYVNSNLIKDEVFKLKGLKNFLEEFSRIDQKEAIEVNLWEYYLIYAQILGIADKVAKQFKRLYPEFIGNNEFENIYNDLSFIDIFSSKAIDSAVSSRKESYKSFAKEDSYDHKERANRYSSGGGGFSSGRGGGGSFGSGGGGGGFR